MHWFNWTLFLLETAADGFAQMHFCFNLLLLSLPRSAKLPLCSWTHKTAFQRGASMKRSYFHFVLYSLSFIFPQSYIVLHKTFKVANIDKLNHLHSKCSCCKSMELTLLLQFTFTATCYITASSAYLIFVTGTTGAARVKNSVGCKFFQIERQKTTYFTFLG